MFVNEMHFFFSHSHASQIPQTINTVQEEISSVSLHKVAEVPEDIPIPTTVIGVVDLQPEISADVGQTSQSPQTVTMIEEEISSHQHI